MAKPYFINRKEVSSLSGYPIKTVVKELNDRNYSTAYGYKIINKDVYDAVRVMNQKHSRCEWVEKQNNKLRISLEGYYWLENVYFEKNKKTIEADVEFFEQLIETYIQNCQRNNIQYELLNFISNDMTMKELSSFTNSSIKTIKRYFDKLPSEMQEKIYYFNKEKYIISSVCEELCIRYFKKTYLLYLENMYLILKKKIIKAGVKIKYE